MFAQQYNWDNSITANVRAHFEAKVGIRLCDIVCKWKAKWKINGDEAMPRWMDPEVWKGLKVFWVDPKSEIRSTKCSTSRNTSVGGHGPSRHTSGQKTYARRALDNAEKNGGVVPPIVKIMEETHKRKDGTFVDGFAEQICNEVATKITERESQLSPGGGGLSTAEKNAILFEIAPKNKKGRFYGVGSIEVIPSASTSAPPSTSDDYGELKQSLEEEKKRNAELVTRMEGYDHLFGILAQEFPTLATAIRAQRPPEEARDQRDQTRVAQEQTMYDVAAAEAATAHLTPQE